MRHLTKAHRPLFLLIRAAVIILLAGYALPTVLHAQTQTIGLFVSGPEASPGYTLFAPIGSRTTYLIDIWGRLVNSWESDHQPGLMVYLLENGDLLRTASIAAGGGGGGRVEQFTWDGTLIWQFDYNTADYLQHHDIEPLPNGNVLILAWENKSQAEAIAAGRNPAFLGFVLSPEHIVEVEPTGPTTGDIVWEWHLWDHLIQDFDSTKANYGVVGDHPELIDLNFAGSVGNDWIHGNSVDYNPALDQVVISARRFDEFWIIDHSTTTAEAAGHAGGNSGMGGDILYRWGNPRAYRAGTVVDQRIFNQHDVQWIPEGYPGEGNITILSNGGGRPGGNSSSADEVIPAVDGSGHYPPPAPGEPFGPEELTWMYQATPPTSWFNSGLCGAQRQPNGNTLICSGQDGEFFEVRPDSEIVWRYVNPVNGGIPQPQGTPGPLDLVFRAERYPPDFPGFVGRDLTPGAALEIYPITMTGTAHSPAAPTPSDSVVVTTTITSGDAITVAELYVDLGVGFAPFTMFDDGNHHDGSAGDGLYGTTIPPTPLESVSYYVHAENDAGASVNDPPNPPNTVYFYTVCCQAPRIFINEFMASNTNCCQDEHGDFDPWIELYNAEVTDVDLSGMYLTNDLNDSARFMIGDTVVPALGFIVFWTDNEPGEGLAHTNFVLSAAGGEIGLYDADGNGRSLVDSVAYAAQMPDTSYGRVADGAESWTFHENPTPGAANASCACPNQADAEPDGFITALDMSVCIDILFAGGEDLKDATCVVPRFDLDCDGFSTALDLSIVIDHLFAGGPGPCDPCGL